MPRPVCTERPRRPRRYGGALGAQNSVSWGFSRLASISAGPAEGALDEAAHEALFEVALEAGADDVSDWSPDADGAAVVAAPDAAAAVRDALAAAGFRVETELVWAPENRVDAPGAGAALDALDDLGDVSAVFHNASLSAEED